ncbi:hypothetical protein QJQ45_016666, partial [Haematococcus lacustris]
VGVPVLAAALALAAALVELACSSHAEHWDVTLAVGGVAAAPELLGPLPGVLQPLLRIAWHPHLTALGTHAPRPAAPQPPAPCPPPSPPSTQHLTSQPRPQDRSKEQGADPGQQPLAQLLHPALNTDPGQRHEPKSYHLALRPTRLQQLGVVDDDLEVEQAMVQGARLLLQLLHGQAGAGRGAGLLCPRLLLRRMPCDPAGAEAGQGAGAGAEDALALRAGWAQQSGAVGRELAASLAARILGCLWRSIRHHSHALRQARLQLDEQLADEQQQLLDSCQGRTEPQWLGPGGSGPQGQQQEAGLARPLSDVMLSGSHVALKGCMHPQVLLLSLAAALNGAVWLASVAPLPTPPSPAMHLGQQQQQQEGGAWPGPGGGAPPPGPLAQPSALSRLWTQVTSAYYHILT